MFALIDANNFYTTCETVFRPDLTGRPIVVVSNNDGCIISRSAEAKALGLKMGEPYFKIKQELQRQGVVVFSSNYTLYADMSHRMMTVLSVEGPALEVYSIDEAFMDLSGVSNCLVLETFGHHLRSTVLRHTGLTVGVGIAPTKTLAKLANYAAKKWTKAQGVIDLSCPQRQRKLMALIDIGEVWGVGGRIQKRLQSIGVNKVIDLANCNTAMIRKNFNVVLERTVRELNGESCIALEEAPPPKQQIICSRSFGKRILELEDMQHAVVTYATRAAEKLRDQRSGCCLVGVFIATARHGDEPQYANSVSMTCEYPTNDTRDIIGLAHRGLAAIWRQGYRYAKAGIMLGDFYQTGIAQLDMFSENQPKPGAEALMFALDKINRSGMGKVWFAGQGTDNPWLMKREMLSPRYTTCLDELLVVK